MSKYDRTIKGNKGGEAVVDVYDVLKAFNVTCPARAHAIKKLLCAGLRGKGDEKQDLCEAVLAVERAVGLLEGQTKVARPEPPPAQSPLPTKAKNPQGLHRKYLIHNADGTPVPEDNIYFVLRLCSNQTTPTNHERACRAAAMVYADAAAKHPALRQTALDLKKLVETLDAGNAPPSSGCTPLLDL